MLGSCRFVFVGFSIRCCDPLDPLTLLPQVVSLTFDFADNSELLSLSLSIICALTMMKSPMLQQGRRNVSKRKSAHLRTPEKTQKNENCPEISNVDSPSIAQLMKLNEAGILSKDEVRAMLFNRQVLSSQNQPRTTTPPPEKHRQPRPPLDFRESQYDQEDFSESQRSQDFSESQRSQEDFSESQRSQEDFSESQQSQDFSESQQSQDFSESQQSQSDFSESQPKKKRSRCVSPLTTQIRTLARDCTRRRFFDECIKPDSLLWKKKKPTSKSTMDKRLFRRAAQDPMDELYETYPGPLFKVSGKKLRQIIQWRVVKDRNNWCGKVPKRDLYIGAQSFFDWEAHSAELEKTVLKRTLSGSSTVSLSSSSTMSSSFPSSPSAFSPCVKKENKKKSDKEKKNEDKLLSKCATCSVAVWIGRVADASRDIAIAYPLNSNWNSNCQPYCEECWDQELKILQDLGAEHCAVGAKKVCACLSISMHACIYMP